MLINWKVKVKFNEKNTRCFVGKRWEYKVRNDKGTDAAFEMVRTYFEKIGMDTGFDSVYEETKFLTDFL